MLLYRRIGRMLKKWSAERISLPGSYLSVPALPRNAGGIQGAKMGLFFGVVNAFQWYANSWK